MSTSTTISQTISKTNTYIFTSIKIINVVINPNTNATIYLTFSTDDGKTITTTILLEGNDYTSWGADDNYLYEYIQNNISTILNVPDPL